MRIASDTGGTFTDVIVEDNSGELRIYKASTVPDDPAAGVLAALELAAADHSCSLAELFSQCDLFIHGTTHAINAVITGRIARTAFLTSQGHPDILTFREGGRTEPFNYEVPFPAPYIPRALTFEVSGRIDAQGDVQAGLDEGQLQDIITVLRKQEVEAVAVCLLWSIVNPEHENRVAELLEKGLPGVPYTLSHKLNPTLREYRRASSTAIDASLKPVMGSYLSGLEQRLAEAGFSGRLLVLTSQGGAMNAAGLAQAPIHAINSGPSMAPVAGRYYGNQAGHQGAIIVADTGGTTFDISLVRGESIPWTRETWIGEAYRGHMTGFPSIDIKSIGAGGGSIAWVDSGGVLHVGPESAGAAPGPVCYDRGGEYPTVSDAALVLGFLDPDFFLGGSMPLNLEKARNAIDEHVARALGSDTISAAKAILDVVTENMVQAIESIAVNQGIDASEALLLGGGGAAGLNSLFIARRLGCKHVCFPDVGAVLSASGALISDLTTEHRIMHFTESGHFDFDGVNQVLERLRLMAEAFVEASATGHEATISFSAEARYPSQVWEIEVPLGAASFTGPADVETMIQNFHAVHREIFAFADTASNIEVVSWCVNASCPLREDDIGRLGTDGHSGTSVQGRRLVHLPGEEPCEVDVLNFLDIERDKISDGPVIIETPHTSIIIDRDARYQKTGPGSLLVSL